MINESVFYAYRSLDDAAQSIKSMDVVDHGDVIAMGEGDLPASDDASSLVPHLREAADSARADHVRPSCTS
jgi:hypothetical protein